MKKLIFVASPYAGANAEEIDANVLFARQICRRIFDAGAVPFAPHLLYPGILTDANPEERAKGIEGGKRVMLGCDEFWLVLPPWRGEISTGMVAEHGFATALNLPTKRLLTEAALVVALDQLRAEAP